MKNLKISEANLNRVLQRLDNKDVAFITAFRTDPSLDKSKTENRTSNKSLEQELNSLGYRGYIKVTGYYNETPEIEGSEASAEESFMVMSSGNASFDDFAEDVIKLGNKYNQQSVAVWNHKEKTTYLYDCSDGSIMMTFPRFSIDDITQAWTQTKNHKFAFSEALENTKFQDHFNQNGNWLTAMAYEAHRKSLKQSIVMEKFTSNRNLVTHYQKHVVKEKQFGDISYEEYEKLADELQRKPVDYRNILGYVSSNEEGLVNCKYDKDTGLFVVYRMKNGEPETITCYIKTWRKYEGQKAAEYIGEIPEGE